ncbi:MAG: radical SAM protein [Candidatus Krumholzibacteria bacterium]|nr:radical SAM protein [Candidatus Krumholzibacteria bacterium]
MRTPGEKRIFGPVPSRRLGLSLGIDVIPRKTCTFDCVYCECGETTDKTCERREFCAVRDVLDDLEAHLSRMKEKPDVITLSGSGEPTLYLPLGELIDGMKRLASLPVAVITNSSLLWMPEVRDALARADVVLPSLDAAEDDAFRRINRPHELVSLPRIIEGLERFLKDYRGTVLFEILLIKNYNTDTRNIDALKAVLGRMRADTIQLNTAVRPGTESEIEPLDDISMHRIRNLFGPRCEVIASARTSRTRHEETDLEETILSLLARRPCTAEDLHRALGMSMENAESILQKLVASGAVVGKSVRGTLYFSAPRRDT